MQETENERLERVLFYLMLIFSGLAYLGYYLYARSRGIPILISYTRSSQAMMQTNGALTMLFRFGKDICAVLLLILEALSMNRTHRANIFVAMMMLAGYGTVLALVNRLSLNTIISGYRMIVYFSALAMYFNGDFLPSFSIRTFLRIITGLLLVNTFIAAIQAYRCVGLNFFLIGKGSYRFMGLFPAAAAYAFFCFGAALFAYCIEMYTDECHANCMVIFIVAFIGCYISGTRSSMINLLVVYYIYMMEKANIEAWQKGWLSIIFAIPLGFIVIRFAIGMANRGSILENAVNGGRLTVLLNTFFHQPLSQFIFGNGIGAGSNAAAVFANSPQALVLDGTFTTILFQFGVVGLIVCAFFVWAIGQRVYWAKGFLSAALFTGTIVLQCMTCNVLEAFALLIMLFVCYYTLISGDELFDLTEPGAEA